MLYFLNKKFTMANGPVNNIYIYIRKILGIYVVYYSEYCGNTFVKSNRMHFSNTIFRDCSNIYSEYFLKALNQHLILLKYFFFFF